MHWRVGIVDYNVVPYEVIADIATEIDKDVLLGRSDNMYVDGLVILSGLWGFIGASVLLPAFVAGNYRLVIAMGALILVVNSLFLYFNQQMLLIEALLRSTAVALIHVSTAYLIVHFFHHKRSVSDLFRRTRHS